MCAEKRTWEEIASTLAASDFKTGGLGSFETEEYGVWVCFPNHPCLSAVGHADKNDSMCYVYNEKQATWHAWKLHSEMTTTFCTAAQDDVFARCPAGQHPSRTGEPFVTIYNGERGGALKYPPVPIVGNFSFQSRRSNGAVSGQPYGNGGYGIQWSSDYGYWYPSHVFDGFGQPGDYDRGGGGAWNHNQYDQSSGDYLYNNYVVEGYKGDWIKLELPEAIVLSHVKVYERSANYPRSPR
jgi:hypothetical protein